MSDFLTKQKYPLWQWILSAVLTLGIFVWLAGSMTERGNQFSSEVDRYVSNLSQEAKLEGAWLRLSGPVDSVVFSSDRTFQINYPFFGSDINHDYYIYGDRLNYTADGVSYTIGYKLENNVLTLYFEDATCTFRKANP